LQEINWQSWPLLNLYKQIQQEQHCKISAHELPAEAEARSPDAKAQGGSRTPRSLHFVERRPERGRIATGRDDLPGAGGHLTKRAKTAAPRWVANEACTDWAEWGVERCR
jgi:hypothetical protein